MSRTNLFELTLFAVWICVMLYAFSHAVSLDRKGQQAAAASSRGRQ